MNCIKIAKLRAHTCMLVAYICKSLSDKSIIRLKIKLIKIFDHENDEFKSN